MTPEVPPRVPIGRRPVIPPEKVAEARRLHRQYRWSFAAIGRRLGIDETWVARICRGEARKDVQP